MDLFEPISQLPYPKDDFWHVLPIAIPALFGLVVLILDLYLDKNRSRLSLAGLTALACALSAVSALKIWAGDVDQVVLGGSLVTSAFGAAMALPILMGTTIIGLAVAHHGQAPGEGPTSFDRRRSLAHGELYGLMLFGTAGMLALVVANDLVTFFVAIETLSLAVYALTGVDRRRPRSAEGAMKYFILGAFSAGFLLYGMSLIYGATQTMRFDLMAQANVPPGSLPLATTGGALILIGLLFKVGAIPFHAWVPDAYEGAPSAVTGYMSVGVKVAAFAGALHLIIALGACGALNTMGVWILWVIAALTVIAGNAGALTQRNPRRLLAYSAIAHTGYLLVGVVAVTRQFDGGHPGPTDAILLAGKDATAGLIFYLLAYGAANLGAFAVLVHLERNGQDVDSLSDLAGLAQTQPKTALVMLISLLSLAGIPGTAGFLGKLWVFRAGVAAGDVGLVVLALVASAISLYYYLKIVVVMYLQEPHAGTAGASADDPKLWCSKLAAGSAAALTIIGGLYPTGWLLSLTVNGAEALI